MIREDKTREIVSFLNNSGVEVIDVLERENNTRTILTDKVILVYVPKDSEIFVSFNICTGPKEAAEIVLMLAKLPEDIQISLSDVFLIRKGKIISGEEAIEEMELRREEDTIKDFIERQRNLFTLCFSDCAEC